MSSARVASRSSASCSSGTPARAAAHSRSEARVDDLAAALDQAVGEQHDGVAGQERQAPFLDVRRGAEQARARLLEQPRRPVGRDDERRHVAGDREAELARREIDEHARQRGREALVEAVDEAVEAADDLAG